MKRVGRYIAALFVVGTIMTTAYMYVMPAQTADAQALTEEQKAKLRAEYDQLQVEIAQWQKVLDDTRAKKNTLQGDVTSLDAQIKKAQAEIGQRNITISSLAGEINQKTKVITSLEAKLQQGRDSLAKLLREKNQKENTSLTVLALSSGTLSEFFSNVNAIDSINRDLQAYFDELRSTKTETEQEKDALDKKKNAQLDAKYEVEVKKTQIAEDKAEKNNLLTITKKEESSYQQVLADRQKRATEIRNALFELRDTQGISFQSAMQYATEAEKATGVRAAFTLGILRQESNLGVNVGQCLLVDPTTGSGKGKNTGTFFKNVMKPDRDVQPFLDLMQALGDDPYVTPVSCPQSVGYGGAMGPSQFIASTWKGLSPRLAPLLGVTTPDPWNARHAVMATALYLKELGANRGTYTAETEAAGRYYAGGNWKTLGASYAKSVLGFATKYQSDIDFLNEN